MEPHNTSLSNISPRHRPLQRSCSVQPEVTYQGSILYPPRKKLKNPGRSLTEIFTSGKTRTRASSSDSSLALRRRTFTAGAPLLHPAVLRENDEKKLLNRSFSEMSYSSFHDDVRSVCSTPYDSKNSDDGRVLSHVPLLDPDLSMLSQEMDDRSTSSESKQKCGGDDKNDAEPTLIWRVLKTTFRILFWLIVLLLIITLLVLGFSMYFLYEKTQCDLKRNVKMPLEELNRQLSLSVIGQEIAINVILNSLKDFETSKVNFPLILWMVGWSGSGKTHTTSILRNVLSSVSSVFTVLPSLYPQNNDELLKQEVFSLYDQLDPCSRNVIVIDGWDEDDQPLRILEHLVINIKESVHKKSSKGKTVIVLCGTQGSQFVNREYMNFYLSGKRREDFKINDFEGVSERVTRIKEMNGTTKSFVLVPFLPMEAEQVRMCIEEEFSRLRKSNLLTRDYDQKRIIGQVIEQLDFFPPSHPLMATTGCKRVQPLIRLSLYKDADNAL